MSTDTSPELWSPSSATSLKDALLSFLVRAISTLYPDLHDVARILSNIYTLSDTPDHPWSITNPADSLGSSELHQAAWHCLHKVLSPAIFSQLQSISDTWVAEHRFILAIIYLRQTHDPDRQPLALTNLSVLCDAHSFLTSINGWSECHGNFEVFISHLTTYRTTLLARDMTFPDCHFFAITHRWLTEFAPQYPAIQDALTATQNWVVASNISSSSNTDDLSVFRQLTDFLNGLHTTHDIITNTMESKIDTDAQREKRALDHRAALIDWAADGAPQHLRPTLSDAIPITPEVISDTLSQGDPSNRYYNIEPIHTIISKHRPNSSSNIITLSNLVHQVRGRLSQFPPPPRYPFTPPPPRQNRKSNLVSRPL